MRAANIYGFNENLIIHFGFNSTQFVNDTFVFYA